MLGVGGAGMRGLAIILAASGARILGTDQKTREAAEYLQHPNISILEETAAEDAVRAADLVIHTDAIGTDHPLMNIARTAQVPTQTYHEALADVTRQRRTIAVTGTHGKSSTTSMLAHIFVAAGLDPTALVGASNPAWNNANARIGQGDHFIVEADEYRNHFLALTVESAIITTIDFDHPDFFASLDDVKKSFSQFVQAVSPKGVVIVPTHLVATFSDLPWPAHTQAVAAPTTPITLTLPGRHMQYNAWLAVRLAAVYSIDEQVARAALATYPGLGRRFEFLGNIMNMAVISDYGHHPEEIASTLQAARERYREARLCAIFEAHTGERLRRFFPAFCEALSLADGVVIAPVFVPAGRDKFAATLPAVTQRLEKYLVGLHKQVFQADILSQLSHILTTLSSQFDVTIVFSAGNVDSVVRSIVKGI